ncbi:TlpA family protein disulfide reductase [Trichloromonas sp.]|uniref:TlpA family protein disulfide reductase n=1 Tax=Trichloromonas sp. TaxID=3069249 RepID=UPI002A447AA5|nr:TlpA disulfide reductase family protein [Trichloromonas sp.]
MRLSFLPLFAILLLGTAVPSFGGVARPEIPPSAGVKVGALAPDIQLFDLNGKVVNLEQYRGKVVMLNFWATWCPPCRQEMPAMQRLHEKMQGLDFVMIALNVEPEGPHTVPSFLQGKTFTFPILLDSGAKAQNRYGVFRFPETFIIGKDGVILNHILGAQEWDNDATVDYLTFLAKG